MQPLPKNSHKGRFPIVASGSNAAPARLLAKFGRLHCIPVTRATLHNFAVVFAGHFTAYGAIPATLCPHPGAHTETWITWLTPDQLTIMHQSEGVMGCREAMQRYDFVELDGIELNPEHLPPVSSAGAYLARRMLAPDGAPVRFAEVPAKNGELRARSHNATLRLAAGLLEPAMPYDAFMHRVLSKADARQTLFEKLTPYTLQRPSHFVPSMVEAT